MRRLISILLVLTIAGCKPGQYSDIVSNGTVRLEISGKTVFAYDESSCQMSFNREKCEFCVFTDNTSDYFTVALSSIPSSEGEYTDGDVTWTTSSSIESRKSVPLKLVKQEGDKVWLLDSDSGIALCLRKI